MTHKYTVADFFCGAGGFSEGFHQAGFNVVFALDNWKPAIETHKLNHPYCDSMQKNILELDTPEKIDKVVPDTDIIIGSPPCVSFSNSNKSMKLHEDDESLGLKQKKLTPKEQEKQNLGLNLMKAYLRIILHKKGKPGSKLKYWILENVENSKVFFARKTKDNKNIEKRTFTCKDLDLPDNGAELVINYLDNQSINSNILNAYEYGTPQKRKRLIVGEYVKPNKSLKRRNMKDVFENLGAPSKTINTNRVISDLVFKNIKIKNTHLTDHYYDTTVPEDKWEQAQQLKVDHGYMGKMAFPEDIDRPSRTVMATESYSTRECMLFAKENNNCEYRGATIRELACFMGFPINYQFYGNRNNKHKQIGNAVCVPLSFALAKAIRHKLEVKELEKRIEGITVNLNDMEIPLFHNYQVKPRKITSKFHLHPPNLKVSSYRVELVNINSNFNTETLNIETFKWEAIFYKGAGKESLKIKVKNEALDLLLNTWNQEVYQSYTNKITNQFEGKIYDSLIFQKKLCLLDVDEADKLHLSPKHTLEIISNEIKDLNLPDEETVKSNFLDELLFVDKSEINSRKKKPKIITKTCYKYPVSVLLSLHSLNLVEELLANI